MILAKPASNNREAPFGLQLVDGVAMSSLPTGATRDGVAQRLSH